jgi:hypothetical protein
MTVHMQRLYEFFHPLVKGKGRLAHVKKKAPFFSVLSSIPDIRLRLESSSRALESVKREARYGRKTSPEALEEITADIEAYNQLLARLNVSG